MARASTVHKNTISKFIGIIYKIRPYLGKATLKNPYFTCVYPYVIYCLDVWGNACDIYLEPIIKIQKRCIRQLLSLVILDKLSHYLKNLKC